MSIKLIHLFPSPFRGEPGAWGVGGGGGANGVRGCGENVPVRVPHPDTGQKVRSEMLTFSA